MSYLSLGASDVTLEVTAASVNVDATIRVADDAEEARVVSEPLQELCANLTKAEATLQAGVQTTSCPTTGVIILAAPRRQQQQQQPQQRLSRARRPRRRREAADAPPPPSAPPKAAARRTARDPRGHDPRRRRRRRPRRRPRRRLLLAAAAGAAAAHPAARDAAARPAVAAAITGRRRAPKTAPQPNPPRSSPARIAAVVAARNLNQCANVTEWVDVDSPSSATATSERDGVAHDGVFSDEFNRDGRTMKLLDGHERRAKTERKHHAPFTNGGHSTTSRSRGPTTATSSGQESVGRVRQRSATTRPPER